MDFERYTDERVHMLKVRAMGQLLIIVFALVVLIKAPMFDIYCVRVSGYSMEASFHSGSEYLMKKSGYTLERGDEQCPRSIWTFCCCRASMSTIFCCVLRQN